MWPKCSFIIALTRESRLTTFLTGLNLFQETLVLAALGPGPGSPDPHPILQLVCREGAE